MAHKYILCAFLFDIISMVWYNLGVSIYILLKILIYKEDKIMMYEEKNDCKKDIFTGELIKISYVGGKKCLDDLIASGLLLEVRRI